MTDIKITGPMGDWVVDVDGNQQHYIYTVFADAIGSDGRKYSAQAEFPEEMIIGHTSESYDLIEKVKIHLENMMRERGVWVD